MEARTRVLVAHGVPLMSAGISAVLAQAADVELVSASGSRRNADVVIADASTALRLASADNGRRNVLIVSHDDGEALVRQALAAGVRGFLLQDCGAKELKSAVRTLSRGGTAFAPSVTSRIAQTFANEQLTEREMDVLRLMIRGLSNKDVARDLAIALGTVKSHMKSILTKLGAARRTEAAAIAQRRGIVRLSERSERHRASLPSSTLRPSHQAEIRPRAHLEALANRTSASLDSIRE